MPTERKFYISRYLVEVLSEEECCEEDLESIFYRTSQGDCSGAVKFLGQETLDGVRAAKELIAQGSEPEFFNIDKDGNDTDNALDLEECDGEHAVFLVVGDDDCIIANGNNCIEAKRFKSQAELDAFLKGIDMFSDSSTFEQFDTLAEAEKFVAEVLATAADADDDDEQEYEYVDGEWAFTAVNNFGMTETFDGYDNLTEAHAAIERLRDKGYIDFSAPELIPTLDEDEED